METGRHMTRANSTNWTAGWERDGESQTCVELCTVRLFWWRLIKLIIDLKFFSLCGVWILSNFFKFDISFGSSSWKSSTPCLTNQIWFHIITIQDEWCCVVGGFSTTTNVVGLSVDNLLLFFYFFFIFVSALLVFFFKTRFPLKFVLSLTHISS